MLAQEKTDYQKSESKDNQDSKTVSLTIPDVVTEDISEAELIKYSIILGAQFAVIVCLCCIQRSAYLNKLSAERIERALERQDKKD